MAHPDLTVAAIVDTPQLSAAAQYDIYACSATWPMMADPFCMANWINATESLAQKLKTETPRWIAKKLNLCAPIIDDSATALTPALLGGGLTFDAADVPYTMSPEQHGFLWHSLVNPIVRTFNTQFTSSITASGADKPVPVPYASYKSVCKALQDGGLTPIDVLGDIFTKTREGKCVEGRLKEWAQGRVHASEQVVMARACLEWQRFSVGLPTNPDSDNDAEFAKFARENKLSPNVGNNFIPDMTDITMPLFNSVCTTLLGDEFTLKNAQANADALKEKYGDHKSYKGTNVFAIATQYDSFYLTSLIRHAGEFDTSVQLFTSNYHMRGAAFRIRALHDTAELADLRRFMEQFLDEHLLGKKM